MLTAFLIALASQQPAGLTVQQGDTSLTFGSQLRFRHETRDPAPPVTGASSDSFSTGRFRFSFDAALGEEARAYLQFQSVVASDGMDSDEMVHQAFAELFGEMADLQVGRFEMLYGSEAVISNGDWGRTGSAFDGVRVRRQDDSYWADLFLTQPVEAQAVPIGVDQSFGGVYFGVPAGALSFEGYALLRDDRKDGGAMTDDMTFGARALWKMDDGPAASLELASQSGDHGALDAGGMLAIFDVNMGVASEVTVGVNLLYASGDDDPADGDDDAFKPLFNTPHKFVGAADLFALTNVVDASLYADYKASKDWKFKGVIHSLSMAEDAGAIPDLRGGLTPVAGEDDLGIELDLMAWYTVNDYAGIHFGISQYLVGDAIAGGDDQLWAFAQLVLGL